MKMILEDYIALRTNEEVNKIIEQPYTTWPIKILGFVPNERSLPAPSKVLPSLLHYAQQGLSFLHLPYSRTDVARNKAAIALLARPEFDFILMMDNDHRHDPDMLQLMARWVLLDPSIRIVSGKNFQRNKPYAPCFFTENKDGERIVPLSWPDTLFEVNRCGTGCILIHRSVFTEIDAGCAWFRYEYDQAERDYWPGEDIYFSKLCEKHGIKMYVDPEISSTHITEEEVTEETFRRHYAEHGMLDETGAIR